VSRVAAERGSPAARGASSPPPLRRNRAQLTPGCRQVVWSGGSSEASTPCCVPSPARPGTRSSIPGRRDGPPTQDERSMTPLLRTPAPYRLCAVQPRCTVFVLCNDFRPKCVASARARKGAEFPDEKRARQKSLAIRCIHFHLQIVSCGGSKSFRKTRAFR